MKTLLLISYFVLCLCSLAFSQGEKDWAKDPNYQRYLKLATPVLEEDSARIVTQTNKTKFVRGEDVVLDISLQNVGTKAFGSTVGKDDPDFFFDIVVTGPDSRPVPFSTARQRRRNSSGPPSWLVSPKQTKDASVWLSSLFLLCDTGKYTVVVSKKFKRNDELVAVSSTPLTFRVNESENVARWN